MNRWVDLVVQAMKEEERKPQSDPRPVCCGQDSCTCTFHPGECMCACPACLNFTAWAERQEK